MPCRASWTESQKVIDLIYYHHPAPLINDCDQPYRPLVACHAARQGPRPSEAMGRHDNMINQSSPLMRFSSSELDLSWTTGMVSCQTHGPHLSHHGHRICLAAQSFSHLR